MIGRVPVWLAIRLLKLGIPQCPLFQTVSSFLLIARESYQVHGGWARDENDKCNNAGTAVIAREGMVVSR